MRYFINRVIIFKNRQTPCLGGFCSLKCKNIEHFDPKQNSTSTELHCITACENICIKGHRNRLCSECEDFYYKHEASVCKPCNLNIQQKIILFLILLIFLLWIIWLFMKKFKLNNFKIGQLLGDGIKGFKLSEEFLLEIFMGITLLMAGISSTSSLLFLFFTTFIVYLQKLKSPPYTKNIFIFYIQTLEVRIL